MSVKKSSSVTVVYGVDFIAYHSHWLIFASTRNSQHDGELELALAFD